MKPASPHANGGADSGTPRKAASSAADEATVISDAAAVGAALPRRAIGIPRTGGAVREVGRYQILEKLGEGAMATVYKACDLGIDRPLALKLLHPELCRDADCRTQFLREAKAASMLSHPNIVAVFGSGEVEGRPYLCMELVNGKSLSAMLAGGEALPPHQALDIATQLASALEHAHDRGIVHRDVKPGNIMCVAGAATVKLADFGIARLPSAAALSMQNDAVMGTPHYMSPEQLAGGAIDALTDLWALGIIVYQMVSGRRPFEASTRAALLYRIANDHPLPLAELRRDIPPGLGEIIERCLNKQPEMRVPSARALGDALGRIRRSLEPGSALERAQSHPFPHCDPR